LEVGTAPLDSGNDLLVWRCPGVDNVGRLLQALVLQRVEKQVIVLLDDWPDRLAAGGSPTTEQVASFVLGFQLFRLPGKKWPVGSGVCHGGLHLTAQDPTLGIQLLDGKQGGVDDRPLADGHGAGARVENADLDRLTGCTSPLFRARRGESAEEKGGPDSNQE